LPRLPLQPDLADGGDLMSPCSCCSCCCSLSLCCLLSHLNPPTYHTKQEQAVTTFSSGENMYCGRFLAVSMDDIVVFTLGV
jgi:hypothetical protein